MLAVRSMTLASGYNKPANQKFHCGKRNNQTSLPKATSHMHRLRSCSQDEHVRRMLPTDITSKYT